MENQNSLHVEHGQAGGNGQGQGNDVVTITIDSKKCPIHRGSHLIPEIKQAGNVPAAYVLELIKEGGILFELKDNERITILGGEQFISHIPSGASS